MELIWTDTSLGPFWCNFQWWQKHSEPDHARFASPAQLSPTSVRDCQDDPKGRRCADLESGICLSCVACRLWLEISTRTCNVLNASTCQLLITRPSFIVPTKLMGRKGAVTRLSNFLPRCPPSNSLVYPDPIPDLSSLLCLEACIAVVSPRDAGRQGSAQIQVQKTCM